jgi:hypothetical protein
MTETTDAEVPVVLDCVPAFALRARYTFSMLGLIAGFRPRFCTAPLDGPHVLYSVHAPLTDAFSDAVVHVPASLSAQAFLLAKNSYHPSDARVLTVAERTTLALFPVDPAVPRSPRLPSTDCIADAFYFLSLHGEWSGGERDPLDRTLAEGTLLGTLGLLDSPVVADIAACLGDALRRAGFQLRDTGRFAGASTAVCLTHDIDHLSYFRPAFLFREFVRLLFLNQAGVPLGSRVRRCLQYSHALLSKQDPPKASIEKLLETERRRGVRATWFFKSGGRDKRDAGYPIGSGYLRSVYERLQAGGHEIGLHPSFQSYLDPAMIARECAALSEATGAGSRSVRQHFLRFRSPDTWNAQVDAGLCIDSTLGFAEREGFRNGSCHPFLAFDHDRGRVLPLWEVPLIVMDGTLQHYRGLSIDASRVRIAELARIVAQRNGVFTTLIHNIVSDQLDYPGWDALFDELCTLSGSDDVYNGTLSETVLEWVTSLGYVSLEAVQKNIAT